MNEVVGMKAVRCTMTQSHTHGRDGEGNGYSTFDSLVVGKELDELRGISPGDNSNELVNTLRSRG